MPDIRPSPINAPPAIKMPDNIIRRGPKRSMA
jgi:hypothetical protein